MKDNKSRKADAQSHSHEKPETSIDLNAVLASLPHDKRAVIQSAIFAMEQRSFSGPLPAPEDFAEYERILPGATDRIMKMAEKQVDHRIESEKAIINNKFGQSKLGQLLGAVLVALFGIIALVLGLKGHDSLAKGIGVTTVIAVAVVFVLNKLPFFDKGDEDDGA